MTPSWLIYKDILEKLAKLAGGTENQLSKRSISRTTVMGKSRFAGSTAVVPSDNVQRSNKARLEALNTNEAGKKTKKTKKTKMASTTKGSSINNRVQVEVKKPAKLPRKL